MSGKARTAKPIENTSIQVLEDHGQRLKRLEDKVFSGDPPGGPALFQSFQQQLDDLRGDVLLLSRQQPLRMEMLENQIAALQADLLALRSVTLPSH